MPNQHLLRRIATEINPRPKPIETPGFYRATVSAVNGNLTTVSKPGAGGGVDQETIAERLCNVNVGDVVRVYKQAGLRVIVGVETGPGVTSRWATLNLIGAWINRNGEIAAAMIDPAGFMHIRGTCSMPNAVAGNGYPIADLPAAPTQPVLVPAPAALGDAGQANLSIDTGGTITFIPTDTQTLAYAFLDAIPPFSVID